MKKLSVTEEKMRTREDLVKRRYGGIIIDYNEHKNSVVS